MPKPNLKQKERKSKIKKLKEEHEKQQLEINEDEKFKKEHLELKAWYEKEAPEEAKKMIWLF